MIKLLNFELVTNSEHLVHSELFLKTHEHHSATRMVMIGKHISIVIVIGACFDYFDQIVLLERMSLSMEWKRQAL